MIELAKTGRWLGGLTPTGYKSKRIELVDVYEQGEDSVLEKKKKTASMLVPIEEEIKLIEKIGYKFLELKSLNKLQLYFLQNNISSKNNIDFSVSTLRTLLTNPVYAPNDSDVLEYGKKDNDIKDWIISVGLHPPAFKKGLVWIRIQELLEKNKDKRYRANCKHDFLFSGILRCSKCGSYMRPKIAQGERFYYICELKEKSRGTRCNSKNITGLTLDKLMIKKLEEIFVPTSDIYQELSQMAIKKDAINTDEKEEELKKKLKTNSEAIKNLIDKLKYVDIEVVDLINEELKKLKQEKKQIESELLHIEQSKENKISFESEESKTASLILDIIDNSLKTFEYLDIKSKKDILRILIEDMRGSGQNVDVKLLNTKIGKTDRRLFSNMFEETTNKKDLSVVSRIDKQFH